MDVDVGEPFNDLEKLLLLAGLYWYRREEGDTEEFVPTILLINLVLHWRGVSSEDIEAEWEEDWDQLPVEHQEVFVALFKRVHLRTRSGDLRPPVNDGEPLFIGKGNWGIPGDPNNPPLSPVFTLCQTTPYGLEVAEKLLAESPDFALLMETSIEVPSRQEGFTPDMDEPICQMLNLHLFGGEIAAGSLLDKLTNFKQRAHAENGGSLTRPELPINLQSEISNLHFMGFKLPCVYTATWIDGDSPGSVWGDFFKQFQHLNSCHFRMWEFHKELFFVDLSGLEEDPLKFGDKVKYARKEELWLAGRVAEALEVARSISEKSVLVLERYYHGPARTPEMIAESFRNVPSD